MALLVFRLLETSLNLAISWGDPTQTAQGYLIVCGVPPVPPGASLDPEKLAVRQQMLEELAQGGKVFESVENCFNAPSCGWMSAVLIGQSNGVVLCLNWLRN